MTKQAAPNERLDMFTGQIGFNVFGDRLSQLSVPKGYVRVGLKLKLASDKEGSKQELKLFVYGVDCDNLGGDTAEHVLSCMDSLGGIANRNVG